MPFRPGMTTLGGYYRRKSGVVGVPLAADHPLDSSKQCGRAAPRGRRAGALARLRPWHR
jgi:hypothetical protein